MTFPKYAFLSFLCFVLASCGDTPAPADAGSEPIDAAVEMDAAPADDAEAPAEDAAVAEDAALADDAAAPEADASVPVDSDAGEISDAG